MTNSNRVSQLPARNEKSTAGPTTENAGRFAVDGKAITKRTTLTIPDGMPINAWRNLGKQIFIISDSSAWWLGDWLIYGQAQYPGRYKHAISETSLDYQTLRNYAWVARRFSPARRREKLSFQHHAEVASLAEEDQDALLSAAETNGWSRNELRRQAQRRRDGDSRTLESVSLHVSLETERKQRWEQAAEQTDKDLLAWIVASLDAAATVILDDRAVTGPDDKVSLPN
ncbi:LmbU family transcriptional regulator [Dactylosporangium sp. NPDC005572]|uniref:LmbU family transcriptional regulator n=1 Tax=Dactylosporangium sp. NPDC005572 TaxID=3156889 RepID=UPI0033BD4819